MTLNARLEKLRFLAMEMQLAQRLAQSAPTDADARMLVRHVLIRAKDFIEHARQLRKPLVAANYETRSFHELKEYVGQEFKTYFQTVRDKLGAHVQDLDFVDRIAQWNSIDGSKSEFFVDAAAELYRLLEGLGVPGCAPLGAFPELADPAFIQGLADYRSSGSKVIAVEIGSDALSMTRPNSTSILSVHPIHARAAQLALLHRWVEAQRTLLVRFAAFPNVVRILRARIITDVISACDCLITRPLVAGSPQEMDGLDNLLTASEGPDHPVETFKGLSNIEPITGPLRIIRNKIGGHLDQDPAVPLSALLQMLDGAPLEDALALYNILRGVFRQTALSIIYLRSYLADGAILNGVLGVENMSSVVPFEDDQAPGRVEPVHETFLDTEGALAAKLEDWLTGDEAAKVRARNAFYQAFSFSPVVESFQGELHLGASTHQLHLELRSAHRFLLQTLLCEANPVRVIGMLDLATECASGSPETLAEVLLRFAESEGGVPFLSHLAACIGDLARWRNARPRKFLEAGLPDPGWLGIQSRIALLRMFVRSEGLILANRGQAADTLANIVARLTEGCATPGLLLTKIALASQFCDPHVGTFASGFDEEHSALRADIVRLASGFVRAAEVERVGGAVRRLADNWDYPGICAYLFDELKGGDHEWLGAMLLDYVCDGAVLAANHDRSRRHLGVCLLRREQFDEALDWAERIAAANPVDLDLQVFHAQALACLESRRGDALRRVAEIERLYQLDAQHQGALDEIKTALAAADALATG